MAHRFTFHGKNYRAQLSIWDLRCPGGDGTLNYSVYELPQDANKSTAFSCGCVVYYGPHLDTAIRIIKKRLQLISLEIPRRVQEYLATESSVHHLTEAVKELQEFDKMTAKVRSQSGPQPKAKGRMAGKVS